MIDMQIIADAAPPASLPQWMQTGMGVLLAVIAVVLYVERIKSALDRLTDRVDRLERDVTTVNHGTTGNRSPLP